VPCERAQRHVHHRVEIEAGIAIGANLRQIGRLMKVKNVRLFSRAMCSWCMEAKEWLARHGIAYNYVDVGRDAAAQAEMVALSHQPRVPVIEVDGHVLADFGAEELEAWWKKMGFEVNQ